MRVVLDCNVSVPAAGIDGCLPRGCRQGEAGLPRNTGSRLSALKAIRICGKGRRPAPAPMAGFGARRQAEPRQNFQQF